MPETIEENRKEDAGSRPEDLIDGPAAYEQVAEKEILQKSGQEESTENRDR